PLGRAGALGWMARAERRARVVSAGRRVSTPWEVFRVAEPLEQVRPARALATAATEGARALPPTAEPLEQVRPARALATAATEGARALPPTAEPARMPEAAARAPPPFGRVRPTAIRARSCRSGIRSPTVCSRKTMPATARTCSSWRSRPTKT